MVQVKNLILCAHRKELREQHQKKFLFDIVANGINGIDVDKCALKLNSPMYEYKCYMICWKPYLAWSDTQQLGDNLTIGR